MGTPINFDSLPSPKTRGSITPYQSPGGGGGGRSILGSALGALGAGQKVVNRAIGPAITEFAQGGTQLLSAVPGAIGSQARREIAANQAAGIKGFSFGEMGNFQKDNTGHRMTNPFDQPATSVGTGAGIAKAIGEFAYNTATDPLSYIGGTTVTAAGRGSRVSAKVIAAQLGEKALKSELTNPEAGLKAASTLLTVGRGRGIGKAMSLIDKSPLMKQAVEEAGFTTARRLGVGVGTSMVVIPGTAKVMAAADKVSEAIRVGSGLGLIQATFDARSWASPRGLALRRAAEHTLNTLHIGDAFVNDIARHKVYQSRVAHFTRMIDEVRTVGGYDDAKVEAAGRMLNASADRGFRRIATALHNGTRGTLDGQLANDLMDKGFKDALDAGLPGIPHQVADGSWGYFTLEEWKANTIARLEHESDRLTGKIPGENAPWLKGKGGANGFHPIYNELRNISGLVEAKRVLGLADLKDIKPEALMHVIGQEAVSTKEFMRTVQDLNGIWKSLAVSRPSFANRNWWGGVANNMAYGVNRRYYKAAGVAWNKVKNGQEHLLTDVEREMIEGIQTGMVAGHGISAGTTTAENAIPFQPNRFLKGTSKLQEKFEVGGNIGIGRDRNPLGAMGRIAGRQTTVPVEFQLRGAAYLKFREMDGLGDYAAHTLVDSIHIDYQDLSNLDRKLKVIYPFWTWQSRNFPQQAKQFAAGQGLSRGIVNAMVTQQEEHKGEPFPPFLQGLNVPLGGGIIGSSSALPMADFVSRMQNVGTLVSKRDLSEALRAPVINDASPILTSLPSRLMNKDPFTGKPIVKPGAPKGWTTIDYALTNLVPGLDLVPGAGFLGVKRRTSLLKNAELGRGQARYIPAGLRFLGVTPFDGKDFSDNTR